MERDIIDNEIIGVLQKFKDLNNAHEEGKKAQKELTEFVALLRDELKLARDAERTAEFKKNRCQGYVNQQQEVISKLLSVKEENENLKCTITKMESTIGDIHDSSIAELIKKDAEINKIKQDYLKELIKIQEAADKQANKTKAELSNTIEELRKIIAQKEEIVNERSNTITSLQAELKDVKDRAEINLEVYQKKLVEQERKYQAELETWKVAELNQSAYSANTNTLARHGFTSGSYHPGSLPRQMEYQYNLSLQHHQAESSYAKVQMSNYQPVVSRVRNIQPSIVRPLPRPQTNSFQKSSDFLSAHDYYVQNQNSMEKNEKIQDIGTSETLLQIKSDYNQKPKILVPNKKRKLYNSDQNLL